MINLEEIKRITSRATQGPWINGSWFGRCHISHAHGKGDCIYEYTLSTGEYFDRYVSAPGSITIIGGDDYGPILNQSNANFIANSRHWIPELIDEVESLQSKLTASEQRAEKYKSFLVAISRTNHPQVYFCHNGISMTVDEFAREALNGK